MNNKDFTAELAQRLGYTTKDAAEIMSTLAGGMAQQLQDGNQISISDFGLFGVKKIGEHISVNRLSGQRSLVPPRLVITFQPDALLNDKLK